MTRWIGTLVLLVGLGVLAWCATVYLWKDPFTTAYTTWEQRRLEDGFESRVEAWRPLPTIKPAPGTTPPSRPVDVRRDARAYRRQSAAGDAIARLEIPRLDLDVIVVNGTDTADLRRGPGRHLETFMPGEGQLVYVAGHRTTFGAPFSHIDALRAGDRLRLELPYATVDYKVVEHKIVDQYELSVLRTRGREELVLQACHPRFLSSQRYLVYARPVHVTRKQRSS